MTALILLGTAAVAAWAVWTFNLLVKARNQQAEGWSGIDVQLKKRADLVPLLAASVRAYATHESATLRAAAHARNPEEVAGALRGLLAVAEANPDLKASENFRQLSTMLVAIEDDLQYARRFYNGSVRDFRNLCESFPSNLVAGLVGFRPGDFFEVSSVLEREAPTVT